MQHVSPHASTLHWAHFTANLQPRIAVPQRDNLGFACANGLQTNSRLPVLKTCHVAESSRLLQAYQMMVTYIG